MDEAVAVPEVQSLKPYLGVPAGFQSAQLVITLLKVSLAYLDFHVGVVKGNCVSLPQLVSCSPLPRSERVTIKTGTATPKSKSSARAWTVPCQSPRAVVGLQES